MPYTKILIHFVWSTKLRKPLMNKVNKDLICQHIKEYAKTKNIHIININGHLDHMHCFVSLEADQNIMTVMNLIKGESSFWANKNLKFKEKFSWQEEYFAVSVSASHFTRVNNYINNQEEHHQKKSFETEYNEFISKYGFENEYQ